MGLVTLCGLVVLAVEVWSRRWVVVAALTAALAAAAFATGTYVIAAYWLGFPRGDRLLEGQDHLGRSATVHFPILLPVFALAAVVGCGCALALAVGWRRHMGGD